MTMPEVCQNYQLYMDFKSWYTSHTWDFKTPIIYILSILPVRNIKNSCVYVSLYYIIFYYTEAVLANNITPKIMAIFIISKNSWGLHYSDRRFFIKTFWKGIFMQRGNSLLWNIQIGIVWSFTIISEVCKGKKLSPFFLSG